MKRMTQFLRLTGTDIKRVKHYILPLIISVCVLLLFCSAAGSIIAKNLYKEDTFSTIKLGYYLPDDDDKKYNLLALRMLNDMRSIKETAELLQVGSREEGYRLLEQGEILYLIIIPENFFSGIMDSTNPSLSIIVKDNTTISSYIANELFMSYASYLGIAQAGIYSALDTVRAHDFDTEAISLIQDKVNLIYLDRALNKDGYINTVSAANEGNYSLLQHYMASALMLSLFFMSFIIAPLLHGHGQGIMKQLSVYNLNKFHIFLSNLICCAVSLYIAYIPCFAGISVLNGQMNWTGLVTAIPALFIIAVIINLITIYSRNILTGNIVVLIITLIIAYIGGGLLPHAFLPKVIQNISHYLPGEYIISILSRALFGI